MIGDGEQSFALAAGQEPPEHRDLFQDLVRPIRWDHGPLQVDPGAVEVDLALRRQAERGPIGPDQIGPHGAVLERERADQTLEADPLAAQQVADSGERGDRQQACEHRDVHGDVVARLDAGLERRTGQGTVAVPHDREPAAADGVEDVERAQHGARVVGLDRKAVAVVAIRAKVDLEPSRRRRRRQALVLVLVRVLLPARRVVFAGPFRCVAPALTGVAGRPLRAPQRARHQGLDRDALPAAPAAPKLQPDRLEKPVGAKGDRIQSRGGQRERRKASRRRLGFRFDGRFRRGRALVRGPALGPLVLGGAVEHGIRIGFVAVLGGLWLSRIRPRVLARVPGLAATEKRPGVEHAATDAHGGPVPEPVDGHLAQARVAEHQIVERERRELSSRIVEASPAARAQRPGAYVEPVDFREAILDQLQDQVGRPGHPLRLFPDQWLKGEPGVFEIDRGAQGTAPRAVAGIGDIGRHRAVQVGPEVQAKGAAFGFLEAGDPGLDLGANRGLAGEGFVPDGVYRHAAKLQRATDLHARLVDGERQAPLGDVLAEQEIAHGGPLQRHAGRHIQVVEGGFHVNREAEHHLRGHPAVGAGGIDAEPTDELETLVVEELEAGAQRTGHVQIEADHLLGDTQTGDLDGPRP